MHAKSASAGHTQRMPEIVLCTLNARYTHASLGLRYLRANLGELHPRSTLCEFVIGQKTEEIVERLLAEQPRIIGLGVYIWNVEETTRVVAQLKLLAPEIRIVLGGPEVSHEVDSQRICTLADHVITGWGDVSFPALARQILAGSAPMDKVIVGVQPPLVALTRCPTANTPATTCVSAICMSKPRAAARSSANSACRLWTRAYWPFPLQPFLDALEDLYRRGARQFKFVDRTFNLKIDASLAVLEFFLAKIADCPG